MRVPKALRAAAPVVMLVVDAVAAIVFYRHIPTIPRPFDVLTAGVAVLGVLTALAFRWNVARSVCLVVASLGASLFALEMGQKYFNILSVFEGNRDTGVLGDGGPYRWEKGDPATYMDARERARRDGVDPEALADHFAGDVFSGKNPNQLIKSRFQRNTNVEEYETLKPINQMDGPLGFELTPDNVSRVRVTDRKGRLVVDCVNTVDKYGFRDTRSAEAADATYVFLGCSFTFGMYLNDDQTLPYHFSRAHGFGKRVLNLGISAWGPGNVLRDLELDRRMGRADIAPGSVKAVFYGLIDDHAPRVVATKFYGTPYYALEDGRPKFKAVYIKDSFMGRLWNLLDKSRIYPVLKGRLQYKIQAGDPSYKWRLTVAMLAEMDRICRDRYGVRLTVLYWDDDPAVVGMLRENGLETVMVHDAFDEGADWRRMAIKYYVCDGHPSAYANRKLGEYLYRKTSGR